MIRWFAHNPVAANLMMVGIILLGVFSLRNEIALELMPNFQLGAVNITTALPGGSPSTIENAITTRIEEAIADVEGIRKITSRSAESVSLVSAEIEPGYSDQALLADIKIKVDAINTLPVDAERPVIQIGEIPIQVIGIVIVSNSVHFDELYQVSKNFREQLLKVPGITTVSELFTPSQEFHIEISPQTLQELNLSIEDIATAIQRHSIDVSAGNLRTRDGDFLVRADGQAYSREDFLSIPVIQNRDRIVYLSDIAEVTDGYQQFDVLLRYNNERAISMEVFRVGKQSTLDIAALTKQFIEEQRARMPEGVTIQTYADTSELVKGRLDTLISSAVVGGILVVILLSLFLRPAVAFWVSLGVPVCFLGSFILLPFFGLSLNMLTMFAYIIVLGIVVDDAVVTGENIYRHVRDGMPSKKAAVFGTEEVAVPVTFGVITTIVAFSPLLAVEGYLSDITKQIPFVIIPVLIFSLVESKLILPAHLSHLKIRNTNNIGRIGRYQQRFSRAFENTVIRFYKPLLHYCINNKTITIVSALCGFILVISVAANGWLRTSFFPEIDDDVVFIRLSMPATTGFETTRKHVDHIYQQATNIRNEMINPDTGKSAVGNIFSATGASPDATGLPNLGPNLGFTVVEIAPKGVRPDNYTVRDLRGDLIERIGTIPGVERLTISSNFNDFGRPISIALSAGDGIQIEQHVHAIRDYLRRYPGVFDIQDNLSAGKKELQLELKPLANALGLSLANISQQVRAAVFGYEAQRLQRDHEELKVMVRLKHEFRSSLIDIRNLPIKITGTNNTVPLADVAELKTHQSPSAIYHNNRERVVSVSTDIDAKQYDLNVVRQDLDSYLQTQLAGSGIKYSLDGQAETQQEAVESLFLGLIMSILIIYTLLAIPFKSYMQPLVVMSIIPLSIVGAILGHLIMDYAISVLSLMGMLALTGIVVNDSLILVDYINKQRTRGMDIMQAVMTAGEVRFRPVILTSLTTFFGLMPLLLSDDLQAQALIPMAISLGFGIMFATLITLIIIPVNYLAFEAVFGKPKSLSDDPDKPIQAETA